VIEIKLPIKLDIRPGSASLGVQLEQILLDMILEDLLKAPPQSPKKAKSKK